MSGGDQGTGRSPIGASEECVRIVLGAICSMEFDFRFGDLLLTCSMREGRLTSDTVHLMLVQRDVERLTTFLKHANRELARNELRTSVVAGSLPSTLAWSPVQGLQSSRP